MAQVDLENVQAVLQEVSLDEGRLPNVPGMVQLSATHIQINLGYANLDAAEALRNQLSETFPGYEITVNIDIPHAPALNTQNSVAGVKNIVAIASGKGGVGKSTTSVNLALALASEGAKVGVLDADIYGPSQSHMLGLGDARPIMLNGNTLVPLEAHGVCCISMGSLVNENTPMIWRGPMVSGALQQLLNQTQWKDIDYLIIDMPPGTGDIQLTLAQTVPVTGSVVVTTPQDIALLDAKKGIEMFRKVNIPVLGVVENMSTHICSQCGHEEAIFGRGGGDKIAKEFGVDLLGQLPLDISIMQHTESGQPTVAAQPDSAISQTYRSVARQLGYRIWLQSHDTNSGPEISIE